MGLEFDATSVPTNRGHLDTGTQGEGHVNTEAETG